METKELKKKKVLEECLKKIITKINYCEKMICKSPIVTKCNTIICNRERCMSYIVKNNKIECSWFNLNPTYFEPSKAKEIIEAQLAKDCDGNVLKMEEMNEKEYFETLLCSYKEMKKSIESV